MYQTWQVNYALLFIINWQIYIQPSEKFIILIRIEIIKSDGSKISNEMALLNFFLKNLNTIFAKNVSRSKLSVGKQCN